MQFRFTRYGMPASVASLSPKAYVVYDQFWVTRLGEVYRDPMATTRWFSRYDGAALSGCSQSRQAAASRLADEHRRVWGAHSLD